MKEIKLTQRQAFSIWKNLDASMVNGRVMSDLFDIAFPKGTEDKLYKEWVKSTESRE